MGEPIDWGRDLQLIIDLLVTNGQPENSNNNNDNRTKDDSIPLIACSADLLFMDQAPMPR